ncbi:MAG: glycoside hydrolase family 15 protein [Candidatus Saccharimonadales bacterium]
MARPIVLSNSELYVGLNNYGLVHDLYYPYVGLENHSSGSLTRHRVGVWIDGELSWLDDEGSWTFRFRYPHQSLIGHTVAQNDTLGILLEFDDFVDVKMNAFMRNVHVVNLWSEDREVRVFMHQAFVIGDSRSTTDTAQYLPDSDAIIHYRGRRVLIVSGMHNDQPFDQHSIGLFGIEGREGTYRDAEDGELAGGNVEHGRVDSTLRFTVRLSALGSERVHYWLTFGESMREALEIEKQIRQQGVMARLHETARHWKDWLEPARAVASKLPSQYRDTFMHSMMIIKANTDKRGAVIASTDSSMLRYSRDDYEYCWPRDGGLVLWPLIRMGYTEEPLRFFEFCRRGLHPSGYLMHKYRADGGLGASWHSYVHNGVTGPPIQVDETAIVLFVFAQFYDMSHDRQLLADFYESLVKPMASWLSEYTNEVTGLPKASYDLWEEVYLTSTYSTAVAQAALQAVADLAEDAHDADSAVKWRAVADDMQAAAHKYLFNAERQAFYKGIYMRDGEVHYNATVDVSSLYGAFMFGLFPIDSDEVTAAFATVLEVFKNPDGKIGLPRYEDDSYHRADPSLLGNWWPIVTMWQAQLSLERGDEATAWSIIDWVTNIAGPTGMIPEQIDPRDGTPISPSPLTWSQAEYVSTLLDTIATHKK